MKRTKQILLEEFAKVLNNGKKNQFLIIDRNTK